jgi:DNA adenine methylase
MPQALSVLRTPASRRVDIGIDRAAGPIVKWVGGKGKLLPELARRAPTTFHRYFEPFVGGGALFFHLAPRAAVLSDTNAELVGCYRAVQSNVEAVVTALARHRERHSEEYFYAVREGWNEGKLRTSAERAAAFIYLNKTCYNGLWRVNSRGLFNVPAGRYVNPGILDAERLRAASSVLRAATLQVAPFEAVLADARRGDFVYFDPPYHPVSATADFTSYTAEGFGTDDQERLAETFARLDDRGCAVMLSNSDTPFTRRLYARWRVERVLCARAVNSRADRRGAVGELLVTNQY